VVQARAAGLITGTLEDLRALVADTTRPLVHRAGIRP
jgi:hypothetical protein